MVDNFDFIRNILKFDFDGACYYVQLLRRCADDPMTNGEKDSKYHGNMHSRSIKDYLIRSIEHFDDVRDEIKTICDTFNVRAYIRLNVRSYKAINMEMFTHLASIIENGATFESPFHLLSSACGRDNEAEDGKDSNEKIKELVAKIEGACDPMEVIANANLLGKVAGKKGVTEVPKTWIVDLDKEYLQYESEIREMIYNRKPIGNKALYTIPTKSGKHIIVKPFDMKNFDVEWNEHFGKFGLKKIDVHKDNPTILYVP